MLIYVYISLSFSLSVYAQVIYVSISLSQTLPPLGRVYMGRVVLHPNIHVARVQLRTGYSRLNEYLRKNVTLMIATNVNVDKLNQLPTTCLNVPYMKMRDQAKRVCDKKINEGVTKN